MVNVDRYHIRLLMLGSFVAVAVAAIVIMVRAENSHDLVLKVEPISASDQITVYAGGAVASPGLYTLPVHARVATLLNQAGVLDSADSSAMQMAAELHDGQQIIVPLRVAGATPTAVSDNGTPTAVVTGPININAATLEQLETLPGIGPALAQRILDYRNENGPFTSLEQLASVKGISDRMVDDFRDLVVLGP